MFWCKGNENVGFFFIHSYILKSYDTCEYTRTEINMYIKHKMTGDSK